MNISGPQKRVILLIGVVSLFLLATVAFLAYQGRQIVNSRAQVATVPAPGPNDVVPTEAQCAPATISHVDMVACPNTVGSAVDTSKYLIRSVTCSDGFILEDNPCKDPLSCPGSCIDAATMASKKQEWMSGCSARTQCPGEVTPVPPAEEPPPGGQAQCGSTCDFNADGACYDATDVGLFRQAMTQCSANTSSGSNPQCKEYDGLTVNKDGVLDVTDMTECAAYCQQCSASGQPIPTGSVQATPTPMCHEGIQSPRGDSTSCNPTPAPATNVGGGNPGSATDVTPALVRIEGFTCWDGTFEEADSGCIDKTAALDFLERAKTSYCVGKKSPSCSVTEPSPTDSVGVTGMPNPTGSDQTTPIPSGPSCSTKATGDCNCDGVNNLSDFECWRKCYVSEEKDGAGDFNGDGVCNLTDFEIFRKNTY